MRARGIIYPFIAAALSTVMAPGSANATTLPTHKLAPAVLKKLNAHLQGSVFETVFGTSRMDKALACAHKIARDLPDLEIAVHPLTLDVLRRSPDTLWHAQLYVADGGASVGFLGGTELSKLFIGSLLGNDVGGAPLHELVVERRNLTNFPTSDWWQNPVTRFSVVVDPRKPKGDLTSADAWLKVNIHNEVIEVPRPGEHASPARWQDLGFANPSLQNALDELPASFKDEAVSYLVGYMQADHRQAVAYNKADNAGVAAPRLSSEELGRVRRGGDDKATPISIAAWYPIEQEGVFRAFNVTLFKRHGKIDTKLQTPTTTVTRSLEISPIGGNRLFSVVEDTTHIPRSR